MTLFWHPCECHVLVEWHLRVQLHEAFEKDVEIDIILPLNEVIESEDEGDRQQKHGRGVGNDEEGGCDSQEASDPASKNHWHRRVQNINIFAKSVQNSGRNSSMK